MKNMKKILALVLAALLVAGMMTVAFAAGEPTTGTITIKNSENGTTYDFYKILDLTLYDLDDQAEGYESTIYTLNSKWHDFFTGSNAGAGYLVASNSGSLNAINVDGTIKYLNIVSADDAVNFANAAMAYATSQSIMRDTTAQGTGSDVEVAVSSLGYYLMIPVGANKKTVLSSGSLASLTSTNPDVDILVKAKKPDIAKIDDAEDAEIGQIIHYTLTGEVPTTAGYETYTYEITDTMTSGLTFNNDVKIEITDKDGAIYDDTATPKTAETNVTVTYANNGFKASIPVMNYQTYAGKTITLTYTATVNEAAVEKLQEKNRAQLKYGHNPDDLQEGTPIEEEVYSAKITIDKHDGTDTDTKLEGAKFVLMNSEGKVYTYTGTPKAVGWATVTNGPAANTNDKVTDAQIAAITGTTGAEIVETNDQGAAEFKGLKNGTYYLVETEAPTGYNRLDKAIEITIVAGKQADGETHLENVAYPVGGELDEHKNEVADVTNNKGTQLPSTGGIGTTLFYIGGSILVLAAVILLITKRRMSANND